MNDHDYISVNGIIMRALKKVSENKEKDRKEAEQSVKDAKRGIERLENVKKAYKKHLDEELEEFNKLKQDAEEIEENWKIFKFRKQGWSRFVKRDKNGKPYPTISEADVIVAKRKADNSWEHCKSWLTKIQKIENDIKLAKQELEVLRKKLGWV